MLRTSDVRSRGHKATNGELGSPSGDIPDNTVEPNDLAGWLAGWLHDLQTKDYEKLRATRYRSCER